MPLSETTNLKDESGSAVHAESGSVVHAVRLKKRPACKRPAAVEEFPARVQRVHDGLPWALDEFTSPPHPHPICLYDAHGCMMLHGFGQSMTNGRLFQDVSGTNPHQLFLRLGVWVGCLSCFVGTVCHLAFDAGESNCCSSFGSVVQKCSFPLRVQARVAKVWELH